MSLETIEDVHKVAVAAAQVNATRSMQDPVSVCKRLAIGVWFFIVLIASPVISCVSFIWIPCKAWCYYGLWLGKYTSPPIDAKDENTEDIKVAIR